VIMSVFSGAL